jgi:hypothetical protein
MRRMGGEKRHRGEEKHGRRGEERHRKVERRGIVIRIDWEEIEDKKVYDKNVIEMRRYHVSVLYQIY